MINDSTAIGEGDNTLDMRAIVTAAFAEEAHKVWSDWMEYLFLNCDHVKTEDGFRVAIPDGLVMRWQRQMRMGYAELSPAEQASDIEVAERYLKIIKYYGGAWWTSKAN